MEKKDGILKRLWKALFYNNETHKFSATKFGFILMNFLAGLFLLLLVITDIKKVSISQQTVDYAKIFFGFGTPASWVGYVANGINLRKYLPGNGTVTPTDSTPAAGGK